jgi:biopolymer transport protein ExbD
MKSRFSKSRPSLQYIYSGIQYSHILFLPLFIFLYCTTNFRQPLVRVDVPDSVRSAILLTYKQITMNNYPWIYVGKPLDPIICFPAKFNIYVHGGFINIEQIPLYLSEFENIHAPVKKMVYLKIDSHTKMDVIYAIREKISEAGFYRICYVVN